MTNYKPSLQNSLQFTEQFSERLLPLIDAYENASEVAREVGVTEGTIRKWKNGASLPKIRDAVFLAKALNVNLLWLATGEGPKHPQTRGSPDSVQEKSADYVCEPQKGWIRKAVEAVERMRPDAPADRKAVAVEQVYERLVQSDGAADMIEVMRIIQAALEG